MDWFTDITYLTKGNVRQRKAYDVLKTLKIFDVLSPYNPILVGTIPIAIDIPSSDLDIICNCRDHKTLTSYLSDHYGHKKEFQKHTKIYNGLESTVVTFQAEPFTIEIFAQNKPTKEQHAYRHMIIENKILNTMGSAFRNQIISLKKKGYKTEPAFAKLLGLQGDPYEALLEVEV